MDKVDEAIKRLRYASDIATNYTEKPLMICYSGGKDSEVIADLAIKSKLQIEIVNSHTSVDAPETVYHIRNQMHKWENAGIPCKIEYPQYRGKRATMWSLIVDKGMPPTRLVRYCCSILKDTSGKNRAIVTGVRWEESVKRKNTRGVHENFAGSIKDRIIMNNSDNDEERRVFERCRLQGKTFHNIIVDWMDRDIWDYIQSEKLNINPLYSCGFDRVGCVGCPMAGKHRWTEFQRWPKYKDNYIKAFQRMIDRRKAEGKQSPWTCGEECFLWWMEKDLGQLSLFAEDDEWRNLHDDMMEDLRT